MSRDNDTEHEKILHEVLREPDRDKPQKGMRLAMLVFVVVVVGMMALWIVPYWSIPHQARPGDVPSLESVIIEGIRIPVRSGSVLIDSYVMYDDPHIKLVASRVVSAACPRAEQNCYADALFYFVRDNIAYVSDPINEYYELPQETLLAASADCDGQAILLASLMGSVGIRTRFVFVPRHVYVQALVPDTSFFAREHDRVWRNYDTTCTQCKPGELPLVT